MVNKQSLYFIHEQATFLSRAETLPVFLMALLALPVCCVRYEQLQLFFIFFAASLHIIIAKVFSIVFQPASDVMKVFFFFPGNVSVSSLKGTV